MIGFYNFGGRVRLLAALVAVVGVLLLVGVAAAAPTDVMPGAGVIHGTSSYIPLNVLPSGAFIQ